MEPITADDPVAVGGFRLRARLGAGGMGRVYLGTSAGGRAVAVKVVRPDLAQDAEFIRRFRHEVAAAQRVSGAFTAPVIAADLDANPPWLATAFVPGPSLQDWVDVSGPLPEPAVRRLAAGLAEALSAVHACGLVHRDLKPSNVLLAEDGPRVIDFGISRARDRSAVTVPGFVVGTPPFMSPEQAKGNQVGPASDIFSLGAVLCLAATGRPPFGDDDSVVVLYRIVHEPPAIDAIPAPLRGLIARCLTKDPAGRPTLAELMRAFADGGADTRVAVGSFWPPEVAQRVNDFRARIVEGLAEPMFVAQTAPPDHADPATRTGTAFAAHTVPPAHAEPATQTGTAFAAHTAPPARAEPAARTGSATRPRQRRRELVIGGGLTIVGAAVLLAALWPSSPRHPGSHPRADATAISDVSPRINDASPRGTAKPANTATGSAAPHTAQAQVTRQSASPASAAPATTAPAADGIKLQCSATCQLYSSLYGESDVLGVAGGEANTGQPIELQSASSSNDSDDWQMASDGTARTYYRVGLVSAEIDQYYGSDDAYEFQYAPSGVSSGKCLGVSGTARNWADVTLQPCGVSAATIWVADTAEQNGQQVPLINGTDTNLTQPLVLTANGVGVVATTTELSSIGNRYWSTED